MNRETRPAAPTSAQQPLRFQPESTTVWSFPERGAWATHDSRYRGNWSPLVPRNLILRYSERGDLVLDPFLGGGTSAVEAKLLDRRCLAFDLNPNALVWSQKHLRFRLPPALQTADPVIARADALALPLADGAADLLLAHPPYANSIRYSAALPGDLSHLEPDAFLPAMSRLAQESLRVLKPGGVCALLMGDTRHTRRVVPLGFASIARFLAAGLTLEELVIKQQHHTAMGEAWAERSSRLGFLLLAHEYLAVFRKPARGSPAASDADLAAPPLFETPAPLPLRAVQTTAPRLAGETEQRSSVWTLPVRSADAALRRALWRRFAPAGSQVLELTLGQGRAQPGLATSPALALVTLRLPERVPHGVTAPDLVNRVRDVARHAEQALARSGVFTVITRDLRQSGRLTPLGILTWQALADQPGLTLHEIAVVPDPLPRAAHAREGPLAIAHQYLLIYRRSSPLRTP